ncbi:hypothetical protein [Candidatus Methanocrinis natronophilus]|uniref:Uncharacterized protein n=1 Tax=Candidatus Methanocrinis natronophilus TaxID=3033396 RepID=A0ABT5XAT0_9EURY|nr:hypothetical protein [Candidatus Methanocrinis natronophilus]MDF0591788.1 hypothetical protein [Candidatus Methanocrinis natronophilus]
MDDNKLRKIAGVLVGITVVLFVVALLIPEPEPVPDYSGPLDEAAVKKLLPRSERDAEISGSLSSGDVVVTRELSENLTPAMMLSGGRMHSIEIFKNFFEDPRIEKVLVVSNLEFVDTFGQTSSGAGCWYSVTRETADKVNWDNLPLENLDKIADAYFIHPALRG